MTCSHQGFIKRTALADYSVLAEARRPGKVGWRREDDFINKFFTASSHDHVLFFSDRGKVYLKRVFEIPEGSRTSKGQVDRRNRRTDTGEKPGTVKEKLAAIVPVATSKDGADLVTATSRGLVKRTEPRLREDPPTRDHRRAIEDGETLLRALATMTPSTR